MNIVLIYYLCSAIGVYGAVKRMQHRTVPCCRELTIWFFYRGKQQEKGRREVVKVQGEKVQSISEGP